MLLDVYRPTDNAYVLYIHTVIPSLINSMMNMIVILHFYVDAELKMRMQCAAYMVSLINQDITKCHLHGHEWCVTDVSFETCMNHTRLWIIWDEVHDLSKWTLALSLRVRLCQFISPISTDIPISSTVCPPACMHVRQIYRGGEACLPPAIID